MEPLAITIGIGWILLSGGALAVQWYKTIKEERRHDRAERRWEELHEEELHNIREAHNHGAPQPLPTVLYCPFCQQVNFYSSILDWPSPKP